MEDKVTLLDKLSIIQSSLNAPKGQTNKFGGYSYRSCEDILMALKPLIKEQKVSVKLSDEIIMVGDRIYVKATASIMFGETAIESSAFAREPDNQKGMSEPQLTGSASSYARKYALNGLFAIDDTKDSDHDSQYQPRQEEVFKPCNQSQIEMIRGLLNTKDVDVDKFMTAYKILDVSELSFTNATKAIEILNKKKPLR